ncbi:MAG: hypothetical protein LBB76_11620 [Azoarcus sp.]|nr:hypothetical protein [Azoarcus sp.]
MNVNKKARGNIATAIADTLATRAIAFNDDILARRTENSLRYLSDNGENFRLRTPVLVFPLPSRNSRMVVIARRTMTRQTMGGSVTRALAWCRIVAFFKRASLYREKISARRMEFSIMRRKAPDIDRPLSAFPFGTCGQAPSLRAVIHPAHEWPRIARFGDLFDQRLPTLDDVLRVTRFFSFFSPCASDARSYPAPTVNEQP